MLKKQTKHLYSEQKSKKKLASEKQAIILVFQGG